VFERFTERARQAVIAAGDEARELGHGHIGSEHLLLGLLHEQEGVAARALASSGISLADTRLAVSRYVPSTEGQPSHRQLPMTPRGKQILERADEESRSLGNNHVGTEHLLLALADVDDGVAMKILRDRDVDEPKIREAVMGLLSDFPPEPARRRPPMTRRLDTRRRLDPRTEITEPPASRWAIEVEPDGEARRLLMSAAARALETGRTETTVGDLLLALSRTSQLAAVLAELGVEETAFRAALERFRRPEEPPEASRGG
jgi:ATP-dependent Clp protease ATP-binding subunit ClpA